jgi:hypothetical protein
MKLNITVDIDWIEEDGSIDEEVKHQIISGVKNSISKQCLDKVDREASKSIDKAIQEAIEAATNTIKDKAVAFADDWLENEVTITDKWGEAKDTLTITDLIKKTFDDLLEKKVDSNGRITSGQYDGQQTLISYLTGSRVEEVVNKKLSGFSKNIDDQITKAVNSGIRENVSNKFAEMVVATAKANNSLPSIGRDG